MLIIDLFPLPGIFKLRGSIEQKDLLRLYFYSPLLRVALSITVSGSIILLFPCFFLHSPSLNSLLFCTFPRNIEPQIKYICFIGAFNAFPQLQYSAPNPPCKRILACPPLLSLYNRINNTQNQPQQQNHHPP